MAAAAPPPTSPEAQKEVLLSMGLPFGTWRSDAPLRDFEGVTVDDGDGLVTGLNFHDKKDVAFKLADFASLTSLKELNMKSCYKATGNLESLPKSVTNLNLAETNIEGNIESLKDMPLTSCNLCNCYKLTGNIEVFKDMNIKSLNLEGCWRLQGDIESLKDCPLQVLNLSGCDLYPSKFTGDIESLKDCPLQKLDLTLCRELTGDIERLKDCPLQVLNLSGHPMEPSKFTGTTLSLAGHVELEEPNFADCPKITSTFLWYVQHKAAKELSSGSFDSQAISDATRSAFFAFLTCDALAESIEKWVEKNPWLASAPDADGHLPKNVASPMNLKVLARHLFFMGQFELEEGPEYISATSKCVRGKNVLYDEMAPPDTLNSIRDCLIKFMSNEAQYNNEIQARVVGEDQSKFDPNCVVSIKATSDDFSKFAEEAKKQGYYPYAIIMEAGDCSIQSIFLRERPDIHMIKSIFIQTTGAVGHMHALGMGHFDIKANNIIRAIQGVLAIRLIDLDAAAKIWEAMAGAKFSSGTLAPEMFAELSYSGVQRFEAYFASEKAQSSELWEKVRPKRTSDGRYFCVKTFKMNANGQPITDGLPYDLEAAAASIDMWAIGVLLYLFITGESLFPVNRDDDLVSAESMLTIFEWNEANAEAKTSCIRDPIARDLVCKLLDRDPSKRPSTRDVLNHPFLCPPEDIQRQMDELNARLEQAEKAGALNQQEKDDLNARLEQAQNARAALIASNQRETDRLRTQLEQAEKASAATGASNQREIDKLKARLQDSERAAASAAAEASNAALHQSSEQDKILELLKIQGQMLLASQQTQKQILASAEENKALAMAIDARTQAIDARTLRIENLALGTSKALAKGILEIKNHVTTAAEDTVPTVFVILPKEPDATDLEEIVEEAKAAQEAYQAGNKLKSGKKLIRFASKCASKAGKIYGTVTSLASDPVGTIKSVIQSKIEDALAMDEFEMYFVCEMCFEKQSSAKDGPWPYTVSKQSEQTEQVAAKLIPMAKAALLAGKAVNGIAGIGKLMGFPVPTVPQEAFDNVEGGIDFLSCTSNVEEFASVENALGREAGVPTEKLKGYIQREYKRFVEKQDPDNDWAGLSRVILNDGQGIWCCPKCVSVLEQNPTKSYEELRELVDAPLMPDYPPEENPLPPVGAARRRSVLTATAAAHPPALPPNASGLGAAEPPEALWKQVRRSSVEAGRLQADSDERRKIRRESKRKASILMAQSSAEVAAAKVLAAAGGGAAEEAAASRKELQMMKEQMNEMREMISQMHAAVMNKDEKDLAQK